MNERQRYILAITVAFVALFAMLGIATEGGEQWDDFEETWGVYLVGFVLLGGAEYIIFGDYDTPGALVTRMAKALAYTLGMLSAFIALVILVNLAYGERINDEGYVLFILPLFGALVSWLFYRRRRKRAS